MYLAYQISPNSTAFRKTGFKKIGRRTKWKILQFSHRLIDHRQFVKGQQRVILIDRREIIPVGFENGQRLRHKHIAAIHVWCHTRSRKTFNYRGDRIIHCSPYACTHRNNLVIFLRIQCLWNYLLSFPNFKTIFFYGKAEIAISQSNFKNYLTF